MPNKYLSVEIYECESNILHNHIHKFSTYTEPAKVCLDSNDFTEKACYSHNHKLSGETGEAIPTKNGSHKHPITIMTDSAGHSHCIDIYTGPAIECSNGYHVHEVDGNTLATENHVHAIELTTQKNINTENQSKEGTAKRANAVLQKDDVNFQRKILITQAFNKAGHASLRLRVFKQNKIPKAKLKD
jgi:hypothetical protein